MPELPEVETVVRFLDANLKGEIIKEIEILRDNNIVCGVSFLKERAEKKRILGVKRKGKFLLFGLENGYTMLSHLRMEGKYYIYNKDGLYRNKHDIALFYLESGKTLVYNDVRKFGTIDLYQNEELLTKSPLSQIGPDPFEAKPEILFDKIRQSTKPIKELIMNQSIISGIGNIYADETLFASKINPRKIGNRIEMKECESIIEESKRIMADAIELGGSTIKSYHPALGMDGRMQNQLHAYHNEGSCPRCGLPMRRIFMNGRSTHFCPYCQKDESTPIAVAITGPIHTGKSSVTKRFNELGYASFNCDIVAKSLYFDKDIEKSIRKFIRKSFIKKGLLQTDILRKAMLEKKTKEAITGILYPALKKKAKDFIESHAKEKMVILEIPLLKGSGLEDLIDYVIYVDAPLSNREARLKAEGRDLDLLKINSSYPEKATKKEASFIIDNDAGLEELFQKVDNLPILIK